MSQKTNKQLWWCKRWAGSDETYPYLHCVVRYLGREWEEYDQNCSLVTHTRCEDHSVPEFEQSLEVDDKALPGPAWTGSHIRHQQGQGYEGSGPLKRSSTGIRTQRRWFWNTSRLAICLLITNWGFTLIALIVAARISSRLASWCTIQLLVRISSLPSLAKAVIACTLITHLSKLHRRLRWNIV